MNANRNINNKKILPITKQGLQLVKSDYKAMLLLKTRQDEVNELTCCQEGIVFALSQGHSLCISILWLGHSFEFWKNIYPCTCRSRWTCLLVPHWMNCRFLCCCTYWLCKYNHCYYYYDFSEPICEYHVELLNLWLTVFISPFFVLNNSDTNTNTNSDTNFNL